MLCGQTSCVGLHFLSTHCGAVPLSASLRNCALNHDSSIIKRSRGQAESCAMQHLLLTHKCPVLYKKVACPRSAYSWATTMSFRDPAENPVVLDAVFLIADLLIVSGLFMSLHSSRNVFNQRPELASLECRSMIWH